MKWPIIEISHERLPRATPATALMLACLAGGSRLDSLENIFNALELPSLLTPFTDI
jgi:hypothetical protein